MILRTAGIKAKNSAMISVSGKRNIKTADFTMFTNSDNASWAIQLYMAELSYPLATITLSVGRKAFRFKPGDLFVLNYSPYSISNMVVRVLSIEEESLDSERLNLVVMEDINYKANIPSVSVAQGITTPSVQDYDVEPFVDFIVKERPYIYNETPNTVIPIIGRVTGNETGAAIYVSVDSGTSYSLLGYTTTFSIVCELITSLYAEDSSSNDSFECTIDIGASGLSSDANANIKKTNLLLIEDEIISFTDIEANSSGTYTISGLLRGVYNTLPVDHIIDSSSTVIKLYSLDGLSSLQSSIFIAGQTYYFKAIPYNKVDTGEISEASATTLDFVNLSLLPLSVTDLKANGNSDPTTYSDDSSSSAQPDIVLTWNPRVRGTDDIPTSFIACEGRFEVRVYAGSSLVRTEQSSDSNPFFNTWTYTEAMNISDNGSLAAELLFEVYNFINSTRYSVVTSINLTLV